MVLSRLAPRPLRCLRPASMPLWPPIAWFRPVQQKQQQHQQRRRCLSTDEFHQGKTYFPVTEPPFIPLIPSQDSAAATDDTPTDLSLSEASLSQCEPSTLSSDGAVQPPPQSPPPPPPSSASAPSASQRLTPTQARIVPVSPSYFSRAPLFNDHLVLIDSLLTKYDHLPLVPPTKAPKVAWLGRDSFAAAGGHIKAAQYAIAMRIAKRLNQIHPSIMPDEVKNALEPFKRDADPNLSRIRIIPVDKLGRALGVGRRKRAVARAWVIEGTGEVIINGKTLAEAFARVHDRESAIWPLRVTERSDKYNVYALLEGGGPTGQAEAMAMAVAMGMMGHEPDLKPALRRAGCVTRDPREVERKKAGRLKARKKPAWNAR